MKVRNLTENLLLEEAMGSAVMDDANGVLNGVVLLTGNRTSDNKTHYTPKALAEAVGRYEGAKMFVDHKRDERGNPSIQDFGGVYKNVRLDGDRLRADLHLVESKRQMVMSIARMKPAGIGLSIRDKGFGIQKDGVFFVEGFQPKAAYSIDLVANPSTNKDLYEANQNQEEDEMEFKTLTLETLSTERPDLVESIQNAGKAAILKEFEEAKANGKKSETMAAKLQALLESGFTQEVSESVKLMIMGDEISVDTAKKMIAGQKALIESLKKTQVIDGKPVVTNLGQRTEQTVVESAKGDIPSDEQFAAAFRR